jgi:peroxiredoxin
MAAKKRPQAKTVGKPVAKAPAQAATRPGKKKKPTLVAKAGPSTAVGVGKSAKRITKAAAPASKRPAAEKPSKVAPALPGVSEGDSAPRFELLDQRGQSLSSEDLAGQAHVLYFYPKDDTPGCTVEACGFRDASAELARAGVRVIGVSPDSPASHQRFSTKYTLPFTLLADPEQQLATAYGVWALKTNYGRQYMGVVRSTFLIGRDGVIKKAWRGVRVKDHVAQVQAEAENLR